MKMESQIPPFILERRAFVKHKVEDDRSSITSHDRKLKTYNGSAHPLSRKDSHSHRRKSKHRSGHKMVPVFRKFHTTSLDDETLGKMGMFFDRSISIGSDGLPFEHFHRGRKTDSESFAEVPSLEIIIETAEDVRGTKKKADSEVNCSSAENYSESHEGLSTENISNGSSEFRKQNLQNDFDVTYSEASNQGMSIESFEVNNSLGHYEYRKRIIDDDFIEMYPGAFQPSNSVEKYASDEQENYRKSDKKLGIPIESFEIKTADGNYILGRRKIIDVSITSQNVNTTTKNASTTSQNVSATSHYVSTSHNISTISQNISKSSQKYNEDKPTKVKRRRIKKHHRASKKSARGRKRKTRRHMQNYHKNKTDIISQKYLLDRIIKLETQIQDVLKKINITHGK